MIVGIDLGTTNSAVAYSEGGKIKLLSIPQLNANGMEEALPTLPSFLYLAEPEELPNADYAVGAWARAQGAKVPTRLVQSAKSWLSNPAADRKEKILPFDAADAERRLAPVEACAAYLRHIKEHLPESSEEHEIVLTVPASFDEVARALTAEAARQAGFPRITLLEEPQAAFYNWLRAHPEHDFQTGDTILICDVGGGTTDFSLIEVMEGGGFQRMAVGKHLLLGGDNMDAALCHYIETQLEEELDQEQWLIARHQAREAKEAILAGETSYSVWIPGRGSQLIGGGKGLEITREEIDALLLDGFFGLYDFESAQRLQQGSGIRKMGLPFEREPSITKHLAHFLRHSRKPTHVLFNGGAMQPETFQKRITESLDRWFEGPSVQVLTSTSLDLAVAMGAAHYGVVGAQVKSGSPRAFYLAIEQGKVVTLLPRGVDADTELTSEHAFTLLPNTPVVFQLYYSHTRLNDVPGSVLEHNEEEMTPLPPIETVLRFGASQKERIPVELTIRFTEIGTLELWLSSTQTDHRWKLEFQLNSYAKEENLQDETFDVSYLEPAKAALLEAFAVGGEAKLKSVMPTLETAMARPRSEWSPSVLRGLFEPLLAQSEKRGLSSRYAARFWNLSGFFLRPGRGVPLDDFRIKELWKLVLSDAKNKEDEEVQIQKWICYRRIAAGLSKGQQMQLYGELFPLVYDKKKGRLIVKRKGGYAYAEQLRALAALELIDTPLKEKLGEALVERIVSGHGEACDFWALGRLGARQLLYGSAGNVVPPKKCAEWVRRLTKISEPQLAFPLALLARKTDCREVNLPAASLEKVKLYLEKHAEPEELALLTAQTELTLSQKERLFGDSLPHGITLEMH